MTEFRTIGLVGRLNGNNIKFVIDRLVSFLAKQSVEVLIELETASVLENCLLETVSRDALAQRCQLIIVVGGDGSMLAAARSFAGFDVKLLGINRGRLGFLTDISPDKIEYRVAEVLEGRYLVEKRMLLESKLVRDDEVIAEGLALNDVVIHPGQFVRMIEFELSIDNEFVYRQRSDGLIISTPTGSTAYGLSCGGPILHPRSDAMVLVPLNPHALTSRPIVVDGGAKLQVMVNYENLFDPQVSNDGQTHFGTQPGDSLLVSKSSRQLQLIHPKGYNFYETCRTKLGWAKQAKEHGK